LAFIETERKGSINLQFLTAQTCFFGCTNSVTTAHLVYTCTLKKPWLLY